MRPFKVTEDSLSVRWLEDDIPDDPDDVVAFKKAIRRRKKLLQRVAALGEQSIDEFGHECLLACRDHVVLALKSQDAVDRAVFANDDDPDHDPMRGLAAANEPPHLWMAAVTLYPKVRGLAGWAANAARVAAADGSSLHAQAADSIDAMSSDPDSSWLDAKGSMMSSLEASFEADDAARIAYQLAAIAFALRVLQWVAGEFDGGSQGAASAAVSAVVAARQAAVARAFVADGGGIEAATAMEDDAASAELRRQAGSLGGRT
jgi:hypothetical protein